MPNFSGSADLFHFGPTLLKSAQLKNFAQLIFMSAQLRTKQLIISAQLNEMQL